MLRTNTLRTLKATPRLCLQEGQQLPEINLFNGSPKDAVSPKDALSKGKMVIFGVPGAFTPGCSKTHAPGYIKHLADFKRKGVQRVACVSVNDAFVMSAWKDQLLQGSKAADPDLLFLADPTGDFVQALDVAFDASGALGGWRSKRFAAILEDGIVKKAYVEPDNTGLSVTLAENVLSHL